MRRRLLKAGKRWLILGHRWLGIGTGLLFALWIGSGLVMLSVPFPGLAPAERLARLLPLVPERVSVSPDAALAATDLRGNRRRSSRRPAMRSLRSTVAWKSLSLRVLPILEEARPTSFEGTC